MTERLHAPERLWLAGLASLAALIGFLAGIKPGWAIGMAAAIAFAMLTFTNLTLAIAVFCSEPLRLDFNESGVIRVAAVLLVLGWLGTTLTRNKLKDDFLSVHPGMSVVLGLFLGWSILSATWAEDPSATLSLDGGFALGVALILITFTAVRTRNQAVLVAAFLVAGAAASAVYAIISGPAAGGATGRLSNRYLDPNELASTLVAAAALSVGVAQFARRSPGLRLAAYGAGALSVSGILLTASRGGLVALGVALIAAVLFAGRWRGRIALVAVTVAIASVYYYTALAPQDSKERILQSTQSGAAEGEGRTSLWQVGWRMVEANPVQGVGSGNFINASRHYVLRPGTVFRSDTIIDLRQPAHNTFLQMLAELGIVGFSLFVVIVIFSLRSGLLAARNFARGGDNAAEALAKTLVIGLIGLLAASVFISQPLYKQMWLMFGLCAALHAISSGQSSQRSA